MAQPRPAPRAGDAPEPLEPAGVPEAAPPEGRIDTSTAEPPPEPAGHPSEPSPRRERRPGPESDRERGGVLRFFSELPGLIIIAFGLALLIKTFLVQAFYIPSESMVPTLMVGDRVLVNKLVYDFGEPERGDIIVFENPHLEEPDRGVLGGIWSWLTEGFGFASNPEKDFIKRVVGLPGDTVEMRDGRVYVNGRRVAEGYVGTAGRQDFPATEVQPERVFVMGDNRPNSQDSRSSLGQIPLDKVVGKAFVLLWPPSRIEWLSDD